MNKVFLGGTCNGSKWRDNLIELLDKKVQYFNPVVENWTEECRLKEIEERKKASVLLYVLSFYDNQQILLILLWCSPVIQSTSSVTHSMISSICFSHRMVYSRSSGVISCSMEVSISS